MNHATIWLNKSFSSTYNIIEILRASQQQERFRILSSHTRPQHPSFQISDAFEVEPGEIDDREYADFCLDCIRRHGVDVFIPERRVRAILAVRERFDALGVKLLIAADLKTFDLLTDKTLLYAALGNDVAPLPDYRVVNDLAGFNAAYEELRNRHDRVCVKPGVSLFGLGFHLLTESGSRLKRFFSGDTTHLDVDTLRACLEEQSHFRTLLVMQYLPGSERSIDCLAHNGTLLRCVIRQKIAQEGNVQLLENNPTLEDTTRRLTERLQLTGLFNVQFREADGVSYLLEINPRMSGGLHMACLSDVAFPYWAIRLLLGSATPSDIPQPRTGILVGQVNRAVRV